MDLTEIDYGDVNQIEVEEIRGYWRAFVNTMKFYVMQNQEIKCLLSYKYPKVENWCIKYSIQI
jgi:hypothetical protein